VSGRLRAVRVALEQPVEAGAVLFELESDADTLRLAEALALQRALVAQRDALEQQRASGARALGEAAQAGAVSLDEARARHAEGVAAARLARSERERVEALYERRVISDAEYQRAVADADQKAAAAEALLQGERRLGLSTLRERSDRRAQLDALAGEIARLGGEIAAAAAEAARLRHHVAERRVTAPVAGRVGELAELHPGAFVRAGDRLASVVPSGRLRVVAHFEPSAAMGRVVPGQAAQVRLAGFPSTRFGPVRAVVSRVAGEVQDGTVRVELAVGPDAARRIPLQHGLPGSVEVWVERLSPAALLLRQAGRLAQAR
jgi:membrane fusion protein (multidrug efflux system)